MPPELEVPDGNRVAFHVHAEGVQVYTCNGTAWVLKAPDATLYNKKGKVVGTHYAGPTWELENGSKVVGSRIASSPSPDPDAIPWLLLQAVSNSDHGKLSKVTYIQRINTTGGKAPASGCDGSSMGQEVRVPYTADYYFYRRAGHGDKKEPDVPAILEVPDGNKVTLHVHAEGVQIYTCNGTEWVLKAPDATLYNKKGKVVGTHYAGPTWELEHGGKVVGSRIASSPSPDPNAIPWLLLQAVSHKGHGKLEHVTYIQRVDTTGGKAPTTGCDGSSAGAEVRVPYTAEYYFYKGKG